MNLLVFEDLWTCDVDQTKKYGNNLMQVFNECEKMLTQEKKRRTCI